MIDFDTNSNAVNPEVMMKEIRIKDRNLSKK